MVVVRITDGLGNQLFQYAFGRALARRLGVPLSVDLRWFDRIEPPAIPRQCELGRYRITVTTADPARLPAIRNTVLGRVRTAVERVVRGQYRLIERYQPGYSPNVPVRRNTLYAGYWQSERYLGDSAAGLREEFTPRTPPEGRNAQYAREIAGCAAVSLHVRRGDYLTNPAAFQVHGVVSEDYYREAIRVVRERVVNPVFFVFSNDLDWCRDHLPLDRTAVYIEGNEGDKAFEDLRLMSLCRHHVIANSTFSWWGAWLNPRAEKLVIAPRQWFADPRMDDTDLVPERWIRI